MTTRWLLLACTTALALGLSDVRGAAGPGRGKPWEDYEVLIENNMFSRDRGRPEATAADPVVREAPSPERYVLLRGVVNNGDEFVAFLEDMRSGEMIRARSGDEIVRGRVADITLDGIVYERGDARAEVAIGQNLEKGAGAPPPPTPGAPDGDAGEASDDEQPPPAPSTGADDILERLRQKRRRELGQ